MSDELEAFTRLGQVCEYDSLAESRCHGDEKTAGSLAIELDCPLNDRCLVRSKHRPSCHGYKTPPGVQGGGRTQLLLALVA